MLKGKSQGPRPAACLGAILPHAEKKDTVVLTGLDREIHLSGGIDLRTDVKAAYLPPGLEDPLKGQLKRFAQKFGIACQSYGDRPPGLQVTRTPEPKELQLDK